MESLKRTFIEWKTDDLLGEIISSFTVLKLLS